MTLKEMQKCVRQVCEENAGYIRSRKIPVYFEIATEEQVYEFTVPNFTRIIRIYFLLTRLSMRKDISAIYIVLYNVKELMALQWRFTRTASPRRQYLRVTERCLKYADQILKQEENGYICFNDWKDKGNCFRTFHMFFKNKNYKYSEEED